MLDWQQKQGFAEDGYVVAPQVVPNDLIVAARREIQNRIGQDPPATEHRGPHAYFLTSTLPEPLRALLLSTPAID